MSYNTTIILGSLTLTIENNNFSRVSHAVNQIVGKEVVRKKIPDAQLQDWVGTMRGTFTDSDRNTDRDTLQGLRNNLTKVSLVDGIHDGEYYVTGLRWADDSNRIATEQRFTLTIVEDQ